jgi:hypothetical protein
MKTIWKYDLIVENMEGEYYIPKGGKVIHVDCIQPGIVNFWVEVNTDNPEEFRQFEIVGTGHPVLYNAKYIGTAIDSPYIWHLYGYQEE